MTNRGTWMIGTSLALLGQATPAWAQSGAPSSAEPELAAAATPADPADTGERPGEEIVVTAQKRVERLQDVPLTITVITPRALERQTITNLTDLQQAAPELNYTGQPSPGYSIRGSGTQSFTRSSENNVLVVVDGVVQGQLTPPTTSLFDLERVEVLSGPQGMLFGKNASAGVVNIVTASPQLNLVQGKARVTLGEDGVATLNGLVNVPLGSTAALRVTAIHDRRDGWLFNRFNNQRVGDRKTSGVRGRLLFAPTDALRINLVADSEVEKGGNNVWSSRIAAPGTATSIAGRLASCGVVPGPDNVDICIDGPSSRRIVSRGGSGQVDYDLGPATLTSITAYRAFERESDTDSDTRPINALNNNAAYDDIGQWTQELRIASDGRQFVEYVAGLFYYDYDYRSRTDQSGTLGALPFVTTRSQNEQIAQKSKAIFGQANVNLTEQITLIAGGRYTWDELRARFQSFVDPALGIRFGAFTPPDTIGDTKVETENFSWRLGGQFKPNRDLTFFATVSRGYKGPAANVIIGNSAAPRIVKPEIPTNYEIGFKTALLDRRVNLDVSLFRTDVKDFQAQTVATSGTVTQFVFTNADELKFRGAQVNLYARPVEGLNLNAGLLYNRARYGNFIVPCNAPFLTGCTAGPAGNTINAEGRQLANAPKWKVTIGGGYEAPVSSALKAFVDASMAYRSKAPTSPTPDPNLVIGGYKLVDGRLGVRDADNRWSIALFARNLFDERAPTLIFRDPLSPSGNYNQSFNQSAFRVLGLTVDVGF